MLFCDVYVLLCFCLCVFFVGSSVCSVFLLFCRAYFLPVFLPFCSVLFGCAFMGFSLFCAFSVVFRVFFCCRFARCLMGDAGWFWVVFWVFVVVVVACGCFLVSGLCLPLVISCCWWLLFVSSLFPLFSGRVCILGWSSSGYWFSRFFWVFFGDVVLVWSVFVCFQAALLVGVFVLVFCAVFVFF